MRGGFPPAGLARSYPSSGGSGSFYALPSDRTTTWQPGVPGGIPTGYTQSGSTITSTGTTADRYATIQGAIDTACAAASISNKLFVLLDIGDFYLSANLSIHADYVILRGTRSGTTVGNYTRLTKPVADRPNSTVGQSGNPYNAVTISRAGSLNLDGVTTAFLASTALTANGAKGASTITVASASGFSVGDLVRLDELSMAAWQVDPRGTGHVWASSDFRVTYQCTAPDDLLGDFTGAAYPSAPTLPAWFAAYTVADRPTCEMKKISAISGNDITFTTPLHIDYRTANTAKISKYNGSVITGSGVENISAYGFDLGTFYFHLAVGCWVSGCEADLWYDKPFRFAAAFQCEIRRSIHHGTPWCSNSAENYGFIFDWASSDCLVEDSIGYNCDKVVAARAAGAGCVVGYCYFDAGNMSISSPEWVEVGTNASHFVGPHHVLFEGNRTFNADSDFTHGNSTNVTHFRNHLTGFRETFTTPHGYTINDFANTVNGAAASIGILRCGACQNFGYGHSFVGNVLGISGQMSGWQLEGNTIFDTQRIWMPGWAPTAARTDQDPNVKATSGWTGMIRDGNYDYLTGLQLWHGLGGTALSTHTTPPSVSALSDSMYLSAKPSFFGSGTWPWVKPEGATKLYTLPAKTRFDSGDYFT